MTTKIVTRLSTSEIEWIAQEIEAEIERQVEMAGGSKATAQRLCDRLRVMLVEMNGVDDPNGLCIQPTTAAHDDGIIYLNKRRSKRTQRNAFTHELSHHLMNVWVPSALFNVDVVVCHEADNQELRHLIASCVEEKRNRRRVAK